jgi:hypothetical protein
MKMDLSIVGPLVLDKNGMSVHLRVVLQNTGHTPAAAVWMQSRLLVHSSWLESTITNEREKLCAESKETAMRDEDSLETYLQGTGPNSTVWALGVSRSDLDIADRENNGLLGPLILSCVVYRSTYNKTFRQTSASSLIMTFDPSAKTVFGSAIKDAQDLVINPGHLFMTSQNHAD